MNEKGNEMNVANIIYQQLGGGRFCVMTGAKQFMSLADGLQFSLPSRFAKEGINRVRVTLTPMDVYDVEFFKVGRQGMDVQSVAKEEGIYCDMLAERFSAVTGLSLSL